MMFKKLILIFMFFSVALIASCSSTIVNKTMSPDFHHTDWRIDGVAIMPVTYDKGVEGNLPISSEQLSQIDVLYGQYFSKKLATLIDEGNYLTADDTQKILGKNFSQEIQESFARDHALPDNQVEGIKDKIVGKRYLMFVTIRKNSVSRKTHLKEQYDDYKVDDKYTYLQTHRILEVEIAVYDLKQNAVVYSSMSKNDEFNSRLGHKRYGDESNSFFKGMVESMVQDEINPEPDYKTSDYPPAPLITDAIEPIISDQMKDLYRSLK